MIGYYNYTVIMTYLGFCSGLFGLWFAFQDRPLDAVYCLVFSAFCDLVDGRIARRRERTLEERRFGVQIDSLSDLFCFGVLPGAIALSLSDSLAVILVSALFALCALIRLAYFNVMTAAEEVKNAQGKMAFRGLPVTTSGLLFPLLYCFYPLLGRAFLPLYLVVMAATACAFVAPFTMQKPGLRKQLVMCAVGLAMLIVLLTTGSN